MMESPGDPDLLSIFRLRYAHFERLVQSALSTPTDVTLLARLGDDLDVFANIAIEVRTTPLPKAINLMIILPPSQNLSVFDPEEFSTLRTNLAMMQGDIRLQYEEALDSSHHGRPAIVKTVRTGRRGRPRIWIDPMFLRWAYNQRTTAGIHRFLHVGRSTIRNALLEHGIAEPQSSPFATEDGQLSFESAEPGNLVDDDRLNPELSLPAQLLVTPQDHHPSHTTSFTGPLSNLSDNSLDELISHLRSHFCRAGLTMLDGMLRRLGHRVPRDRIRASLMRIDPIQRVFQRICIRRRTYSVPGPNHLWHHDGQHGMLFWGPINILYSWCHAGLIRWGIVIHGFIDGYSRLITGLRASDNNMGSTVLDVFLAAARIYGVPSRLRGDHGVENIMTAAWMEAHRGVRRGSYIWGRCASENASVCVSNY